ncbi:MAG: AAA family ATPase [Acidimicrobiales bacterium]|nr:AAA family ATPase [Acidimicrobiales bacterium]
MLFTDLVSSTALRSRIGEEAADEVRRVHDAVVTGAIETNHGRVVKSLGDGVMAVFESAADAVAAAITAQQRVTAAGPDLPEPVAIRVGVSVGDVSLEGDDYFGTAVNEAARLCGAAQGGQILVADLVRALARGRGGFRFESFGDLELKGLPEPVPTCNVGWDPLPTAEDRVPFPPALVPGTGGAYIGRPDVQATLRGLWDETKLAGPRTGLLVGEPGIGKTRTAYEVALVARESGAVVLFGRCDDELRVPYQPFVEALDWQTRHSPDLPLGRLAGELARLVPDLASRRPGLDAPVTSDPRTEEHRLLEAVAAWLIAAAEEHGLVLVLDDIHWATKPTLRMLMHAVRHAAGLDGVRLLVIGTYRDTDVDRAHPLSAVLGDLQRIDGVRRIPVDPLDVDEVIELVEQAAGHELDDVTRGVATRTHAETEGNPFFVAEVLRHLIESGGVRFVDGRWIVPNPDQIDVPEGVRDVVGQRLSRLSDIANEVLRAASVLGREFGLDIVGQIAGVDEDPLLDAIDEATRARLVEEIDADQYRFAHALVRTSLYDELSASRRRRMHRRVADVLAKDTPHELAALAHHAVEAGPRGGDLSDAIGYVLAAADQARDTRALGEAENLYRKALELLAEDDALPLDRRGLTARCGIGEVLRDQGDPSFREVLLGVSTDAFEGGQDDLVIHAVLANTRGLTSSIGNVDEERIVHLRSALAMVPEGAIADRARLEALLSSELMFDSERRDERLALVDHAIELVEGIDDDLTLAWVLGTTRLADLVPERWTSGLARAELAVAAADRCGDPNLRALNRIQLNWTLLSIGDLARAMTVTDEALAIAEADGAPMTQWTARAQAAHFHIYRDDIAHAAAENDAAFQFGLEIGAVDADTWWAGVTAIIGWIRDADMSEPELIGQLAAQYPGTPIWLTTQALALALRGREQECRDLIARHRLDEPDSMPKDVFWLNGAFTMGLTVRILDDEPMANSLLAAYEPYADHFCHYCIGVNGPMRQMLSYLRPAAGDLDGGIADARFALEFAVAEAAGAWTVLCGIELAELLVRRADAPDVDEARSLAIEAGVDAERLGMPGWVTRSEQLLAQLPLP